MVATTRRAAVYARISTDDQAEHGYSLHDQGRKGLAQADAKGWAVVDTPYVDDGVSGTLRHRPAHGQHYRRYRTSDLRPGSYPRE